MSAIEKTALFSSCPRTAAIAANLLSETGWRLASKWTSRNLPFVKGWFCSSDIREPNVLHLDNDGFMALSLDAWNSALGRKCDLHCHSWITTFSKR
jgi:hypothetical protein